MAGVWRLGEAKVEDVREQLAGSRSAYNTVQTVMNRLVDRGLLSRKLRGNAYVYEAKYDEATYLSQLIGDRLAGASPDARRAALVSLVDRLEPGEREEVARYARRVARSRRRKG